MTVTLVSGSSVTLVTGTETTLTNVGEPGRFQLVADLSNFTATDGIEFRVKTMATPTGTARVVNYASYYGAQPTDDVVKLSAVVPNDQTDGNALIFTARQVIGTGRALLWKVLNLEDTPPNFMQLGITPLGHISNVDYVGTVTGSAMSLVSGASAAPGTLTAADVWGFTGSRSLNGLQTWNLNGYVGQVTGSVMSVISGTTATFDPATVWAFTGSRSLNGLQQWNLVGNISGTFFGNISGTVGAVATVLDKSGYVLANNQVVNISGTITNVFNVINQVLASGVVNPVVASVVQGGVVTVSGAVVADVRSLVGVSGTVIASVVQGGVVSVSGAVIADVRSLVGVSGTVIASAVQGGFVTVSGTVAAVRGGFVTVSGTVIASEVQGGQVTVSGSVAAVRGGFVTVSGTVIADVRSLVGVSGTVLASAVQGLVGVSGTIDAVRGGFVTVSGSVVVGTNNDKTGYFLGTPQVYDRIGNTSGSTLGNILGYVGQVTGSVMSVVSGATVNFDPALVWSFTGSRSLNGLQRWDLIGNVSGSRQGNVLGYVGQVTGSAMSLVSGAAATFDPSTVWSFTGTRSLNGVQQWNLNGNILGYVGQVTGSVMSVVSGATASIDYAQVWSFTGSRSLNGPQNWNLNGYVGQVTGSVMSVVSGTTASIDYASVWSFTGTRSLNGLQTWNLNGYVGQVTGSVMSVVSGSSATIDYAQVWSFTGTRSLNGTQRWDLIGNITGSMSGVDILGRTILDYVAMLAMNDHAVFGSYFYVEATNGSDVTGDGTRLNPYKTITKALSMAQSYRHDAILLMPNASGTTNLYQEAATITVNKAYVQIIGVGSDIHVQPTAGVSKDVFTITADGVGLHQLHILTNGNTSNGVTVQNGVQEVLIHLLHIESASQDGVYLNVATNCEVNNCYIRLSGRDGIRISSGAGSGNYNHLVNNKIRQCTGVGINLLGADASNTRIQGNTIRGNGTGVNIAAGTVATVLTDNRIVDNTTDLVDAGTSSHQEWNWFSTDVLGRVEAVYNVVSGSVIADRVWQYTGTRTVDYLRGLVGVSGTVVTSSGVISTVYNVVSGTSASIDYAQIWAFTGSRSLNGTQNWNLNGNFSGTIQPPISAVATGVAIDYASIWNYNIRTLTSQVFNLPPVEQGNNLNIIRGDTFIWAPTNLGSLANLSKLYFTIKRLYTDLDSESEVQIEKTAGLIYINRAPATVALNGSIVVNDPAAGNITITLAAVETAKLDLLRDVYYDVQFINSSGTVTTLVGGLVTIAGDATRGTTP